MAEPAWRAAAADVSALLPQRAHGGFSETTVPTAVQVEHLAGLLAAEILEEVAAEDGGGIPTDLHGLATLVNALATAAYIENSFFPEQMEQTAAGEFLNRRYREKLDLLRAGIVTRGRTRLEETS